MGHKNDINFWIRSLVDVNPAILLVGCENLVAIDPSNIPMKTSFTGHEILIFEHH